MTKRLNAAQILRLNAALFMRLNADQVGFLLGLLAVAGVAAATWVNAPIGPATSTSGVVEQLNVVSRRCPCALVRVNDQLAMIRSPTLRLCRVGDRIPLDRRKAPVGFRYRIPPGACRFR